MPPRNLVLRRLLVQPSQLEIQMELQRYNEMLERLVQTRTRLFECLSLREYDEIMVTWDLVFPLAEVLFNRLMSYHQSDVQIDPLPEIDPNVYPDREDMLRREAQDAEDAAEDVRAAILAYSPFVSDSLPVVPEDQVISSNPPSYAESQADTSRFYSDQITARSIVNMRPETIIPAVIRWLEGRPFGDHFDEDRLEYMLDFARDFQAQILQVVALTEN